MKIKSATRVNPLARKIKSHVTALKLGLESPMRTLVRHCSKIENLVLLDIGANVGQFTVDIKNLGFQHSIISYEPIPELFRKLERNSKKFKNWEVRNIGIGSKNGNFEINVSDSGGKSSSFLNMKDIHLMNFPGTGFIDRVVVPVSTIPAEINNLGLIPSQLVLKIDVQGFEGEVLKGSREILSEIPFCYIELSLHSLYEGEPEILEILNLLANHGQKLFDIGRGVSSKSGDLLQVDILTCNEKTKL